MQRWILSSIRVLYIWRNQLSEGIGDLIKFGLFLIIPHDSGEIVFPGPGLLIISIDVDQIFIGVIVVKISPIFRSFGLLGG
ncbi:hypothetical protein D3C81_951710 [compost metagenome]